MPVGLLPPAVRQERAGASGLAVPFHRGPMILTNAETEIVARAEVELGTYKTL